MELKISVTKKNKNKIFQLIDALLEEEIDGALEIEADEKQVKLDNNLTKPIIKESDLLRIPKVVDNTKPGKPILFINGDDRPQRIGTWGQVNSFFSIKAALRVLANLLEERNVDSINLDDYVKICIKLFKERELNNFRGFPSTDKDTAVGRFVWHFLSAAHEMGLIVIKDSKLNHEGMPTTLHDWEDVSIGITQEGLEFARLKNNLMDRISKEQILTQEERNWMTSFLKKIDSEGYKEYTILKDVFCFLKDGHNGKSDLWNWFENDQRFIDYIKSWSRKVASGNEEDIKNQIKNLSATFSASKIALLRELGVIQNKRNSYDVISELG